MNLKNKALISNDYEIFVTLNETFVKVGACSAAPSLKPEGCKPHWSLQVTKCQRTMNTFTFYNCFWTSLTFCLLLAPTSLHWRLQNANLIDVCTSQAPTKCHSTVNNVLSLSLSTIVFGRVEHFASYWLDLTPLHWNLRNGNLIEVCTSQAACEHSSVKAPWIE